MKYNTNLNTIVVYVSSGNMSSEKSEEQLFQIHNYFKQIEELNVLIVPRNEESIEGISKIEVLNFGTEISEETKDVLDYYNTPNFEDIDRMDIDDDLKSLFKSEYRKVQFQKILK